MGSRRSRKLKAREEYQFGNLDEVFARIAAEREGKHIVEEAPEQKKPREQKGEDKENPNHPCYKCYGCIRWTKCPGYYQLTECIEQRKRAYERKIAENERK